MKPIDILIRNSQIFTAQTEHSVINNGAIAIQDGQIIWMGNDNDLPQDYLDNATETLSFDTGWITPGLIDCHTHLVYGGNRSDEFRRQLNGESYAQISASGGGIMSTVRATREASEETLFTTAAERLQHWLAQGVTHIEIKSGYGLTLESELKMLRVAQRLGQEFPIHVSKTLLAAHTLPPEFAEQYPDKSEARKAYIEHICRDILPAAIAANLVDAIDGFCENIAFSSDDIDALFQIAKAHNIPLKLHAEQLSNQQGSLLAAQHGALSVDHLEYLDEASIQAMAQSGTVAVLLPAAFYFLQETQQPPVDLLRQYNIPIALATDHNPGSAPVQSLPLMLNMGCRLFALTPTEALMAVTANAAKALGISAQKGSLAIGKQADIVHWPVSSLDDLSYYFGAQQPDCIIQAGEVR